MFAYCNNNPVMYVDYSGYSANNEYEDALEELILWYHELCYECKDNFGFVGDIAVGFDKIGSSTITAEWFIRAMIGVDFRATPALLKRFDQLMAQEEYANYARAHMGTLSAGIEFQFLYFTYQVAIVTDHDETVIQQSVGVNDSLGAGVGVNNTVSSATDVSNLYGTTISGSKNYLIASTSRGNVGLYARSSTGITTDGYVSVGGGFFFGWQQKPKDEGISITWTW